MPNHHIRIRRLLAAVSTAALMLLGAEQFSPAVTDGGNQRSHPDSASAVTAVNRFHAGIASGDRAAVLALLAPDVVILESGEMETLGDYRAHHLAADIDFGKSVRVVRTNLRAAVSGSAAWVSGISAAKGTFHGRPIDSSEAELIVLTASGAEWKIRAIHWSSHSHLPGR